MCGYDKLLCQIALATTFSSGSFWFFWIFLVFLENVVVGFNRLRLGLERRLQEERDSLLEDLGFAARGIRAEARSASPIRSRRISARSNLG